MNHAPMQKANGHRTCSSRRRSDTAFASRVEYRRCQMTALLAASIALADCARAASVFRVTKRRRISTMAACSVSCHSSAATRVTRRRPVSRDRHSATRDGWPLATAASNSCSSCDWPSVPVQFSKSLSNA